jgi:hypothetical protein
VALLECGEPTSDAEINPLLEIYNTFIDAHPKATDKSEGRVNAVVQSSHESALRAVSESADSHANVADVFL